VAFNGVASMGGNRITDLADGVLPTDAVTVRQATNIYNGVNDVINHLSDWGANYIRVNSTSPIEPVASGAEAVAIGPQSVASGANAFAAGNGAKATADGAVAIGFGAQATGANAIAIGTGALATGSQAFGENSRAGGGGAAFGDEADAGGTVLSQAPNISKGTAIGFGAVVQQNGGVALGAGSVASRAAGVAGYVPGSATADQQAAIAATTSTQAAVSVGDAANGQFRQITGVAAGSADSDAANVAQLKAASNAAKASSVQYATNPDGTVNYNQVTLGNGQAPGGTRISNVAPGVQGTDAVNLNQLQNGLNGVATKAYAGVAAAMAMESAPYIAGKVTYAAGMGYYASQSAVALSLRKTSESGRWSITGGVSATTSGGVAVRAGISGVWE
jgi:autotransporter adhesin